MELSSHFLQALLAQAKVILLATKLHAWLHDHEGLSPLVSCTTALNLRDEVQVDMRSIEGLPV